MTIPARLILICCAVALAAHVAPAQSAEVFAGYSMGQMRPGNDLDSITQKGWNASITGYPTRRFGLTADFAGLYGTATLNSSSTSISGDLRQYSFMAGPQFRLFRRERFETSLRAVFGGAHGSVWKDGNTLADQATFAALVGSNVDFNLSRRVALRFSPGMYLTQFGDQTQRNFRFSVGPVFRFGGGE